MGLHNRDPLEQPDRLRRRPNGLETIQALGEGPGSRQSSARPSGKVCFNFVSRVTGKIAQAIADVNYGVLQVILQAAQKT